MSYFHDKTDSDCAPASSRWRSSIHREYELQRERQFVYGSQRVLGVKSAELELVSWINEHDEWYCEDGKLSLYNYEEDIIKEYDLSGLEADDALIHAINRLLRMDIEQAAYDDCDFGGFYE